MRRLWDRVCLVWVAVSLFWIRPGAKRSDFKCPICRNHTFHGTPGEMLDHFEAHAQDDMRKIAGSV